MELAAAGAGPLLAGGAALALLSAGHGWAAGLAVLALGAVLGVLGGLGALRVRQRRGRALRAALEALARGETPEPLASGAMGELSEEARVVDELAAALRSSADRIRDFTAHLAQTSPEIAAVLSELDSGGSEQAAKLEETAELQAHIQASIRGINSEVAKLARSNEETSSAILEMSGSIDEVAESAASLQRTVESSATSLNQLGETIARVAESSDTVERVAQDTASAMSEMERSVHEVVDHVRGASELTSQVSQSADDGSRAVGATIDGIARIRELTRDSKSALEGLAERIDEIGQIANVIGAISDETNLLSLNAAIIAAQAGEHGKAFAVVADQVKTLAQRTTTSTREIERLIQAVQEESRNAVNAMDAGIESVEDGVARSRGAGEALERIRSSASEASSRVAEIARAADEQARNSQHVAEAAHRTSAHVHQISASMAEQTAASKQLLENSESAVHMCRQVSRATDEQRETGRSINKNVEAITEMIRSIQQNTKSHEEASSAAAANFGAVLEYVRKHSGRVAEIAPLVAALRERAASIAQETRAEPKSAAPPRSPRLALGE